MTACYLRLPEVELNYIYQHGLISPNFCHQQGVVGGGPLMQSVMLRIFSSCLAVWQAGFREATNFRFARAVHSVFCVSQVVPKIIHSELRAHGGCFYLLILTRYD